MRAHITVLAGKTLAALMNGLLSPSIGQACAPYTFEVLEEKLNQLKEKHEAGREKVAKVEQQVNGIAISNKDALQWKLEANNTLNEVQQKINRLEYSIEATCTSGCLPNCCGRRAARRSIQGEIKKLDKLMERCKPVVKGYQWSRSDAVLKTRGDDVQRIWECISRRREVKVVCIHGIAGVGKTAVAQAVCNKALTDEHETFGYVLWVEAYYGIELKSFQEMIMRRLSIEVSATDDDGERAIKIRDEIVRRKKCLVIIDFLWENFTLRGIGIPEEDAGVGAGAGAGAGAETEVICKLILISRSRLMCSRIPKDEYFEIKPLPDGGETFSNSLGRPLPNLESEAEDLMKKAVEGCHGLPSEIIMLAYHIRGIQCQSSSEICSLLKDMLSSRTQPESSAETHLKKLEYSYRKLENTTYQNCFLYCALYPKGCPIDVEQLIDNWIWEGLVDEYIVSLQEKRKQGRNILTLLKTARLLEKADSCGSGTRETVKMLSLLHDMAVNLIRGSGKLIDSGNDLTDFPPLDDQNSEIQQASFMYNNLAGLQNQPNCPRLSTLLLQYNPLEHISDNFFTGIPYLKFLDLSNTYIFNLPSSFCELRFLQVLHLRHCQNLRSLPCLSNLVELIVLDLFGTPVEELPSGMEKLKKLRRLDLSYSKLKKFQAGLLSALESLQELLFMMNDGEAYSWRSKQKRSNSVEAYVEELTCLNDIRILQLNFFSKEVFSEYMKATQRTRSRPRLPRFKFCVGGFNINGRLGENSIAFVDGYPIGGQIPEETMELYLSACRSSSLSPNNTLEETGIDFQKLKVLNLFDCSDLTYLFTTEMMNCLLSLEKIYLRRCGSLLGIIKPAASSNTVSYAVVSCCLPKIQELVLIDLPQLKIICADGHILEWPAFRRFSVWSCDKLKSLPSVRHRVGENTRIIKFRGKSFNLDDTSNLEFEEADKPEDIVSFESMKKQESDSHLLSNIDETSLFMRITGRNRTAAIISENEETAAIISENKETAAIISENKETATPPQNPGFIVRRFHKFSNLVKQGRIIFSD